MEPTQLITREHLEEVGVELQGQDIDALLAHLNETLEERIGVAITESLDDAKLKELIALQDQGDDEAVGAWIDENVPELQQITEDERDILLGELAENADKV